ncbi:secretin N-terminal domain-containing protein [Brevundimonas sp.]|uniref:secretin N-terminal domain-containing protein n=1 Tax=Brevundimonas sp. TaxID=1871086 RepID=UPI001A1AE248|nr:secretin N-terminal domain-containing protein [Brevundimonas sp.]MBJ7486690.1 hypothetical protein [Brevundimonas sp.]
MRIAVCAAPLLIAGGCTTFPTLETFTTRPPTDMRVDDAAPFPTGASTDANAGRRPSETLTIPRNSAAVGPVRPPATEADIAALIPDELVDAALAPQPIPQFAATVFGSLLNVPFVLTSDVANRTEIIAGGTGGSTSKRALFRMTQLALKQNGIDVFIDGQTVTIGSAEASGIGAEVTRSRASPQSGARVVQFFPVQTIEVNVLQGLLSDLFPNLGGARITPDPLTNSLLISGPGREVAQVVRVLREIDQPRFAGAQVLRVEPVFWSADGLATSIEQVLTTEGYVVSRQALAGRSVVILAFPTANQILIFTQDPALLERARYWAETLDKPAARGDAASTFVYQVRNTDAQSLGQLAIGQAPTSAQAQPPVGVPGTPPAGGGQITQNSQPSSTPATGASGQFMSGRVLVDPAGNRVIFIGTATEFAQLRTLLQALDTPAPQVVIEVMIAEVTLTDKTALGLNFSATDTRGDGLLTGGTEGISLGSGGLLTTFVGPEFRARLNAEASNDRVNILQRPQLVVRSGGTARFQVGTDVPIITSQRATDTSQNGDGTDILQSVQYRQTGVILELTPVIYGDRVDIQISQENSSAGASPPGISSPTILNRSLTTQIAITDGWTGVLGGLISNNYSKVNIGVPFLKDIPVIGSAFQNNTVEGNRTELLVLITPYIIRDDEDMADFADRYASDMNAAFRTGRGWSYTLTPVSLGSRIRGVGFDLPTTSRPSDPGRTDRSAADAIEPAPASE